MKEQLYKKLFGEEWYNELKEILNSEYFNNLRNFLKEEKKSKPFIPKDIGLSFRSFRETPFNSVKVVIVGQDIYHDEGRFDGLAFSNGNNKKGDRVSPSLVNIIKEIKREYPESDISTDLTSWAKQGVFLINVGLTVIKGKPGSHLDKWKPFTLEIIKKLNENRDGLIFLLWGRFAQNYKQFIDPDRHHILEAGHPSPLNTSNPFIGCGHFSKVNEILESKIKW